MTKELESAVTSLNSLMNGKNLYFFTRDPERGMGIENIVTGLHLVHIQKSQYLDYFEDTGVQYFCLEESTENGLNSFPGSSRILLTKPEVKDYLEQTKKQANYAQTFKVSPIFERTVESLGMPLLNSKANLNRQFEDKISQYRSLGTKVKFPLTIIAKLSEYSYLQLVQKLGEKFVVQFNRGHTGSGTKVIETEADFQILLSTDKDRIARLSAFVEGIPYTVNACITKKGLFVGGLSLQITGDKDLGASKGATIGNDWSKRTNLDNYTEFVTELKNITEIMGRAGFRGMFGVDFIVKQSGEIFIIEINARQTASVPIYSKVQLMHEEVPLQLIHLLEFLNLDIPIDINSYNRRNLQPVNCSQVFIRADKELTIQNQVTMGFYRLQGDNAALNRFTDEKASTTLFLDEDRDKAMLFQKYATHISAMDTQRILVLAPVKGRKLKQGEEIGRIKLLQSAVDDQGTVLPWVKEALITIKNQQL